MSSPVSHIWTAGMRNRGEKSHAKDANRKLLSVPQTGLYQSCSNPVVRAFRVTTLNDRIKNEIHSFATRLIEGDECIQSRPTTTRNKRRTVKNSATQSIGCRESLRTAGS